MKWSFEDTLENPTYLITNSLQKYFGTGLSNNISHITYDHVVFNHSGWSFEDLLEKQIIMMMTTNLKCDIKCETNKCRQYAWSQFEYARTYIKCDLGWGADFYSQHSSTLLNSLAWIEVPIFTAQTSSALSKLASLSPTEFTTDCKSIV